jgi:long-chain acyl-CoA synthetase
MIITASLEDNALKYPHKRACVMHQNYRMYSLTYEQVYKRAHQIAQFLADHGVKKGDAVILIASNSPQWICVFWACLLKGAVLVPLNTQSTLSMIDLVVKQTESKIAFVDVYTQQKMPKHVTTININIIDDLVASYTGLIKSVEVIEEDLVEIMYTSGTTGDPKGVMISYANIAHELEASNGLYPMLSGEQRYLSILPLSHIFEQMVGFLLHYVRGHEIIFVHSPTKIVALMNQHRITQMAIVPEFLHVIMSRIRMQAEQKGKREQFERMLAYARRVNKKWFSRIIFRQIHKAFGGKNILFLVGGASLNEDLQRDWIALGFTIMCGYGLTETMGASTGTSYDVVKIGSVGKPLNNVHVKLCADGEILIKGPHVFKGYYKNPEKTAEVFTDDGWFKTGDFGYSDSEGFLYIRGRKKYMIKSPGGQNVFPEDIEAVLASLKGVKASCVVGLEYSDVLTEIHASIILEEFIPASDQKKVLEKIIEQANAVLASYQHINGWSLWPEEDFPRTVTKKIKKNEVISYIVERNNVDIECLQKNKTYSVLVTILSTMTGESPQSITSEKRIISDLKLDSLMRVELLARIEDIMHVALDESVLTPQATVGDIEELVKHKKPIDSSSKLKSWPRSWWALLIRVPLQRLCFLFIRLWINVEVRGLENLDKLELPAIFMPNHANYLDALVLLRALPSCIRNRMAFAAAHDVVYEDYSFVACLAELVFNTFPLGRHNQAMVKRGLDYCGNILDKGYSVCIFPEGHMSVSGILQEFKPGVGLIALEMGAWIVPVNISGLTELAPYETFIPKKRGVVTVTFGKPVKFSKNTVSYDQARQALHKLLNAL